MVDALRVLVVEDSEDDALLVVRQLQLGGFTVTSRRVTTRDELRHALAAQPWDIVLSDHSLPLMDSFDALQVVRQAGVDLPFIVVSGAIGEEIAVSVMKAGAQDYLLKSSLSRLAPAVRRELSDAADREARRRAEADAARETAARLLLQEELGQSQKMEALGLLAGGIAHDFNNLLAVILGFGELLSNEVGPDSSARERLNMIMSAAESGTSLTRQLLTFSRRQVVQPVELDLVAVVEPIGALLRRIIGEDIELRISHAPDLGPVKCDPGQIEQVVMNLAMNARDAMPRGGTLTIELSNVDLDRAFIRAHPGARIGPKVRMVVRDTGVGMDPATLERIFEPFFTTKEVGKGTGLGLAVVFGIVEQNGGWISVDSQRGQGTALSIYFPRIKPSRPGGHEREKIAQVQRGNETVLLVEDAADLRELACVILETLGYRVLVADGGQAALDLAGSYQGRIDVLLADVVMPGMSGTEVAVQLVARRPGLKVLLMSGYTDEMVVIHGAAAAGHAILQKPFIPRSLARKVREVLDGST